MNQPNSTFVILGDWYIDENWLVSQLESYHSSAPGDIHYLALHQSADDPITNLCAAAGLLLAIRSYFSQEVKDNSVSFLAFGAWNPRDDRLFKRALCPDSKLMLLSPYTLSDSREQTDACPNCLRQDNACVYDKMLINLAEGEDSARISTNRIIRCFEGHSSGMPRQPYRFDWMLPCHLEDKSWDRIGEAVKGCDVKAIIIVDHGAGVVNQRSIKQLVEAKTDKARWFVHTKIDNPEWIQVLKEKGVELEMNVLDFHLAAHRKGARRWWYGERLGRCALELLGEAGGITYDCPEEVKPQGLPSKSAFVLLEDNAVFGIAKDKESESYKCVSIAHPAGPRQPVTIGRTTLFCAALFAQRLKSIVHACNQPEFVGDPASQIQVGQECYRAACAAYDWTKRASEKWENDELSLHECYQGVLSKIDRFTSKAGDQWKCWDYENEWRYWNHSSKDIGIVTDEDGKKVLQLWRGEGVLKGYICVGGPKRDKINDLVSSIVKFKGSKNPLHPFSCLIQSPPGWGKSFLAKCLASHFDLEFLEFSIAQMCDNRDLVDCFATIASVQSRTQKRTLVFIDEINAEVEGHTIMASLLSPVWDGTFVKDGHTFRLRPGVWIFASTSPATKLADKDKGSDFLSRLNGPFIDLDAPGHWSRAIEAAKGLISTMGTNNYDSFRDGIYKDSNYTSFKQFADDVQKTEQVYLIASLLNYRWGPIKWIEERVLILFRDLLPINGYRSLELFVDCFEGIERGKVIAGNVPRLEVYVELRRHIIIPKEWDGSNLKGTEIVEIETRVR